MSFTKIVGPGIATDTNVRVGILTATKFYGDGSELTGVSAGLGTDASGIDAGFFYTNAIVYINQNTTVSSPDPTIAPIIFTRYEDIVISDNIDFTIGAENDLLTSVLNLNQLIIP